MKVNFLFGTILLRLIYMQPLDFQPDFTKYEPPEPTALSAVPNLQTAFNFMGAIGYGASDLPFVSGAGEILSKIGGIARYAGKISNFVGPIGSMVIGLMFPSPSNADVINTVNAHMDDVVIQVINQMQNGFVQLSERLTSSFTQIKSDIYTINAYAAFRDLSNDIFILQELSQKMINADVDEVWYYEMSPCGEKMTSCNMAYIYIAESLQALLEAVSSYAVSSSLDERAYVTQYGDFMLKLLANSILPLARVNQILTREKKYGNMDLNDFSTHMHITNFLSVQHAFNTAVEAYLEASQKIECLQITRTYFSDNQTTVTTGDSSFYLIKSLEMSQTFRKISLSQSAWSQLIPRFKDFRTVTQEGLLLPILNGFNKANQDVRPTANLTSYLQLDCPLGQFLHKLEYQTKQSLNFSCAVIVGGDSTTYQHTYFETLNTNSDSSKFTVSCNKRGYYITAVTLRHVLTQNHEWQYSANSGHEGIYYAWEYNSTSLRNYYLPYRMKCSQPIYKVFPGECEAVFQYATNQFYIVFNNELRPIEESKLFMLFAENKTIIYYQSLSLSLGLPITSESLFINGSSSDVFLIASYQKQFIRNQATLLQCNFNLGISPQINISTFNQLPVGPDINVNEPLFISRDISVEVQMGTTLVNTTTRLKQYGTNLIFSFKSQSHYPSSVSFMIKFSKFEAGSLITDCALAYNDDITNMRTFYNDTENILYITGQQKKYIHNNTWYQLSCAYISIAYLQNANTPLQLLVYTDERFLALIEKTPKNIYVTDNCDWPCKTCTSGNKSQCLTCYNSVPPFYQHNYTCNSIRCTGLQYQQFDQPTQCVNQCPDGTFEPWWMQQCLKCTAPCQTCISDTNQCTSCIPNSLTPLLFNNTCTDTCPSGYYSLNGSCRQCTKNCKTCQNYDVCFSCQDNYSLHNNQCLSQCPSGYFDNNGHCNKCHETCRECVGPSSLNCSACHFLGNSTYFYNNQCVHTCPQFTVTDNQQCVQCQSQCATCYQTPYTCTSCSNEKYLLGSTCVNSCPNGTYIFNSTCTPCSVGCVECSTDKKCIKCSQGMFLHNTSCVQVCPVGYFSDDRNCIKCVKCQECINNYTCTLCDKYSEYSQLVLGTCQSANFSVNITKGITPLIQHDENDTLSCQTSDQFDWVIKYPGSNNNALTFSNQQQLNLSVVSKLYDGQLDIYCITNHGIAYLNSDDVAQSKKSMLGLYISLGLTLLIILVAVIWIKCRKMAKVIDLKISGETTNQTFGQLSQSQQTLVVEDLENDQNCDLKDEKTPGRFHETSLVSVTEELNSNAHTSNEDVKQKRSVQLGRPEIYFRNIKTNSLTDRKD